MKVKDILESLLTGTEKLNAEITCLDNELKKEGLLKEMRIACGDEFVAISELTTSVTNLRKGIIETQVAIHEARKVVERTHEL